MANQKNQNETTSQAGGNSGGNSGGKGGSAAGQEVAGEKEDPAEVLVVAQGDPEVVAKEDLMVAAS